MSRFPDAADVFTVLLADLAGAGTDVPGDLQDVLPFIRVHRIGGSDDGVTDHPLLDVDVFAPTYSTGQPLAEDIRQRLISGPHRVTLDDGQVVVIDSVATITAPIELPWADSHVRRWMATYRAALRRSRS